MVVSSRNLEKSLGNGVKKVEKNELETVILQRRAIRTTKNLFKGEIISRDKIEFQRPCPRDAIKPNDFKKIFGKKINKNIKNGDYLKRSYFNKEHK